MIFEALRNYPFFIDLNKMKCTENKVLGYII